MSIFKKYSLASLVLGISLASPLSAGFVGKLILEPSGCRAQGQCTLGDNFGFIDQFGQGWEADKGDVTDGASIPRWAQIFAGEPFEPSYLPAAVLHDHYSKSVRPVRGWFQTQVMFHEVLIASGVPKEKAALLFAGVLIGSGKWIKAAQGKPCPTLQGVFCINAEAGLRFIKQNPVYGTDEYKERLKQLTDQIVELGLTQPIPIVELARELIPDDIYLENTGGVIGGARDF